LTDTGVFDQDRYFDVFVEYAKGSPDDVLIRITACNRGPEEATLHLLPTLWFRNTWSWGCSHEGCSLKPRIEHAGESVLRASHESLGVFRLAFESGPEARPPVVLFTENESNSRRLWREGSPGAFVKDAFHEFVVGGNSQAVNPRRAGTKAAPYYVLKIPAGQSQVVKLRLIAEGESPSQPLGPEFDEIFDVRVREADQFYDSLIPAGMDSARRNVIRQGYAGLLWSKQFYHYVVKNWMEGDPGSTPPRSRIQGRNRDWRHLFTRDVISMPDKWEYPWFAAWDLAFHMIPFARMDAKFAKDQLSLFLREWYMHPTGQIPAYEFAFDDTNPPVHAWAAWRVYKISGQRGRRDRAFLEGVFQKLLLNFTWWVNRKDAYGKNVFSGGFLGLDNIGVFDRSKPLPTGGMLQQADGTAWMAFYCATMLSMALELAHDGRKVCVAYEDMASKFLEHFVQIADAMNTLGGTGLWHEEDGFYYDQIRIDRTNIPLKTRSMVGLLPLIAVEVLEESTLSRLPGFSKRLRWFVKHRADLAHNIAHCKRGQGRLLLAIPSLERLKRVLRYLLDENEFLSPHGIRSLSRYHLGHPYEFHAEGRAYRVDYTPGESRSVIFGGNSNWRGPIWFPVNYLIVEALERYHHFYGDDFKVECPTGSGKMMTLRQAAREISRRLAGIFLPDEKGRRPFVGDDPRWSADPHWRDLVLFHEYFHGETGKGLGANHQTGWTALAIRHIEDSMHNPVAR
jgi:hypothetical protein